ncbi:DUF2635 domain-containing protein [uncultured Hyphomicrobium sp.]|uniref:DUF2635 domain-containing protein n=1 Tax=uncultured Hyphomicrobium sp. TaxID=194373 RepID=UPI0025F3D339|nr:DUF2635 domain-containing protein [uncultured Hyphomicrobium sp.]
MKMIHVKPMPGKVIRNPANGFKKLDPEGEVVPKDEFWTRREAEGGVVITDPDALPAPSIAVSSPVVSGDDDYDNAI